MSNRSLRFLLASALAVICALYTVEVLHFFRNQWALKSYDVSMRRNTCQQVPGQPGHLLCNVAGYGPTRFQCGAKRCGYEDPSAPQRTQAEAARRENEMRDLFLPPDQREPSKDIDPDDND